MIDVIERLASIDTSEAQFTIEGLEVTLKSVDPASINWVLAYLQPLSLGTDSAVDSKLTCAFLCSDELVVEAADYLSILGNTTFNVKGKKFGNLHSARIDASTTLFYNVEEGIVWIIDLDTNVLFILHSSRTSQPGLEFSRAVRTAVVCHLESKGWVLYHAGAVQTEHGNIMIVGNSGAGKTSLILDLIAGGARYVANEILLVRESEAGIQALGYPMAIAVGLGTALQFEGLAKLVDNPDSLMYPRHRYRKSRVARTARSELHALDDKLQLLPKELIQHLGAGDIAVGGNIDYVVVPQVHKSAVNAKLTTLRGKDLLQVLENNYMGLTYDRSHPVWRAADAVNSKDKDNDESVETLCKLPGAQFQYTLAPDRHIDGHFKLLCAAICD